MGSHGFTDACPKCGNEEMEVYHSSRPPYKSWGICLECGYDFDGGEEGHLDLEELNVERAERDLEPLGSLPHVPQPQKGK